MKNPLDKNKVNKVNTSKHAKSNKIPNLPDKSKPKFGNPVHEYGKRILSKLVIQTFIMIFMLNGQSIAKALTNFFATLLYDDKSVSEVTSQAATQMTSLSNMISTVMHLLIMIIFFTVCISMMLDIMYIAFPWFRAMVDARKSNGVENKSSFVSDYAIEAVQAADTVVGYQYSNSGDKMQTSRVLLDSMLHSLRKPENRNTKSEEHIGNLLRIKNRIRSCKNDYDKIKSLADVEVYYINNRVYFDKILEEY